MSAAIVTSVRSAACPQCTAPEARPCLADGSDHLARWIAAWQAGLLARRDLASAVAELTVIAWQVPVPGPGDARAAA